MPTPLAAGLAALLAGAPGAAGSPARGAAVVPPIKLILIDAKTTRAYGPLPWIRDRHAEMVRLLDKAGARTIALRFYFRDSRGDRGDLALVEAATKSGKVLTEIGKADAASGWQPSEDWLQRIALAATGKPPRNLFSSEHLQVPYEALARAVRGSGSVDVILNKEHKLEGLPLVVSHQGRLLPSLGLRIFLQATGMEQASTAFLQSPEKVFGMISREVTKTLQVGNLKIAIDQFGCALVNLTPPGRGYATYSFVDVLKGEVRPAALKDAIVLIGADTEEMNVETSTGPKNGIELAADQVRALYQYLEDPGR